MVDARITHTLTALAAAILELASAGPISQVSVSDITRAAGINRATFYNHFSTAGELLAAALAPELDEIRAADHDLRDQAELSPEEITRRAIEATVEFVARHRTVFELSLLDERDGTLHRALVEHLEVSSQLHIAHHARAAEQVPDAAIVARFVAEGIVGAIESWLATPELSQERATDAIVSALPGWWN